MGMANGLALASCAMPGDGTRRERGPRRLKSHARRDDSHTNAGNGLSLLWLDLVQAQRKTILPCLLNGFGESLF